MATFSLRFLFFEIKGGLWYHFAVCPYIHLCLCIGHNFRLFRLLSLRNHVAVILSIHQVMIPMRSILCLRVCVLNIFISMRSVSNQTKAPRTSYSDCGVLRCDIVQSCKRKSTCGRNMLSPSSGLKCVVWVSILLACIIERVPSPTCFKPYDGGSLVFRNVSVHLRDKRRCFLEIPSLKTSELGRCTHFLQQNLHRHSPGDPDCSVLFKDTSS
jgi:hypothetical protein